MEVVEACVSANGWFLRTVEKTGRKANDLPEDYKRERYDRLERMRDALFAFTNEVFDICPQFRPPIDAEEKEWQGFRISLDLWDNPSLIDQFVELHGDRFSDDDLDTFKSWKNVLAGPMYCMETYGDKALIMCEGHVFEAVSLGQTWDDMIPYAPDLIVTSLLPFEGMIVLGGFTTKHLCPMSGTGLIRLNSEYRDALNRGIITDSQQFCNVSTDIRLMRQLHGLDANNWYLYMNFADDINDQIADTCRPYNPNVFPRE